MVSEHLSDADLASLALCNHALLSFFPQAHKKIPGMNELWTIDNPKTNFLSRLSHDSPEFYLCFDCERLYHSQNVEYPAEWQTSHGHQNHHYPCCTEGSSMIDLDPWRSDQWSEDDQTNTFYLNFIHVQLAMRGLRYGSQFGIPLEAFSMTRVTEEEEETFTRNGGEVDEEESQRSHQTTLSSIDVRARTDPPGFYIRKQSLLVLEKAKIGGNAEGLMKRLYAAARHICPCEGTTLGSTFLSGILDFILDDAGIMSNKYRDHGTCDGCSTSWLAELCTIDEDQICLNSTQWEMMGPGLTPEDPEWMLHTYCTIPEDKDSTICDPWTIFEDYLAPAGGLNALSEEALLSRNISWLRNQTYRTVIDKRRKVSSGRTIWYYEPIYSRKQMQSSLTSDAACT